VPAILDGRCARRLFDQAAGTEECSAGAEPKNGKPGDDRDGLPADGQRQGASQLPFRPAVEGVGSGSGSARFSCRIAAMKKISVCCILHRPSYCTCTIRPDDSPPSLLPLVSINSLVIFGDENKWRIIEYRDQKMGRNPSNTLSRIRSPGFCTTSN
jgi:hypothetical protein